MREVHDQGVGREYIVGAIYPPMPGIVEVSNTGRRSTPTHRSDGIVFPVLDGLVEVGVLEEAYYCGFPFGVLAEGVSYATRNNE